MIQPSEQAGESAQPRRLEGAAAMAAAMMAGVPVEAQIEGDKVVFKSLVPFSAVIVDGKVCVYVLGGAKW